MVIKIPQRRSVVAQKIYKNTGRHIDEWEISVPFRDDIAWSVVLSYLISTDFKDPKNFARRLYLLTKSNKNENDIKKTIRNFNPFRNRHSCFYNQNLKQAVCEFKKLFLAPNELKRVPAKLTAASKLLKCTILLVRTTEKNETTLEIFSGDTEEPQDIVTLFSSIVSDEETQKLYTICNFGLRNFLCQKMKTSALEYFLREAKIPRKFIKQFKSVLKEDNDFLIDILNSKFKMLIPELYKSAYVISKLAEAGYQTDPRSVDSNGLSALYYALVSGNNEIVCALYYFSANSCFESEGSFRKPDSLIVSNLLELEKILLNDLSISKDFQDIRDRKNIRRSFDYLIRFNEFLTEVNKRILKFRDKLNYYDSVDDSIFSAIKRRDIIVSILDTYTEYFQPMQNISVSENFSSLRDCFVHKNYYYLLDTATAFLFFDNIIYLKERLRLESSNQFSEMESSFFLLILFHVAFDKMDTFLKKTSSPLSKHEFSSMYAFLLLKRNDVLDKMKMLSGVLKNTVVSKENIVQNIPKEEMHATLKCFPEIKDVLQMDRLKCYMKTALDSKVIDVKSVLVIQRTLQVIGEHIMPEKENEFSFRQLLFWILPKEIPQILHRLRDEITHLKCFAFPIKLEIENDSSFFRSIQKEIRNIEKCFNPVFNIQKVRIILYVIKELEKILKQSIESIYLHNYGVQQSFDVTGEMIALIKTIYFKTFRKFAPDFKQILQTVFENLEMLTSGDVITETSQYTSNQLKYPLWLLKYLVQMLSEIRNDQKEFLSELLKMIEECQSIQCLNELRDNICFRNLLNKYKEIILLFNFRQKRNLKNMKHIENIEKLLKILRGATYLSVEDKNKIREEIPQSVLEGEELRKKLIFSIENDLPLNYEEQFEEFQKLNLSQNQQKKLLKFYGNDNGHALEMLKNNDLFAVLENVFDKNCVSKQDYEMLCKKLQLSDESKKKLQNLILGQKRQNNGNNLFYLQNRVKLLKKILIEDNKEIFELWNKVKSLKAKNHMVDKIVQLYLKDEQVRTSVEMLLFDCMILFANEKSLKNLWIKSSKLYSGVNLRNVVSHGNPLLENLCQLLEPEDLSTELVQKLVQLIRDEDVIEEILKLFNIVNSDYTRLLMTINDEENVEFHELRMKIRNCENWKTYAILLPINTKQVSSRF